MSAFDLNTRLARLLAPKRGAAPPPVLPEGREPFGVVKPVPGSIFRTALGPVHVAEWTLPREHLHTATPLDEASSFRAEAARAAARDPRFLAADPESWAFFDTETTSLNSGAGVWVFLTGIGRFVGPAFRVRQFLLVGPEGEEAYLEAVRAELSDVSALVSFHGKSFDAPRLDDRCRISSLDELCRGRPHWDLLHATRRLFGRAWPDCRLRTTEDRLLGFRRVDDLDGAECPAQYFAYLRGGRHRMADVMEHNRLDTVSLAALAGRLTAVYRGEAPDAASALAAGLDWAEAGEPERARPLLMRGTAAAAGAPRSVLERLRRRLKQLGEVDAALKVAETAAAVAVRRVTGHTLPAVSAVYGVSAGTPNPAVRDRFRRQ